MIARTHVPKLLLVLGVCLIGAPASVVVHVRSGSRQEPPGKPNLLHFLRDLARPERSADPKLRAIRRQIENGPRGLANERAAARREGIPLTPRELRIPSPPPERNAAPIYLRLAALLKEKPLGRKGEPYDQRPDFIASVLGTRHADTPDEIARVRQMLEERRDVMGLIYEASDKPDCVFPRDWTRPQTVAFSMTRELVVIRNAVRLLKAESYLQAKAGHFQEAITNQARGLRIGGRLASDPVLDSYLVGIACYSISLNGMRDILYLAGPNAEVATGVSNAVATYRPPLDLHSMLREGVVIGCSVLNEIRHADPKALSFLMSEEVPARTPAEQPVWDKLFDAVEAEYLRQMRRVIAVTEKPYPERKALYDELDQLGEAHPADPVRAILSALSSMISSPALAQQEKAYARADEATLLAGAALLAHKARHGVFPAQLGEALPQPPLDPFNGRSLGYRREGEGFIVYSAGPDGDFDGQPSRSKRPSRQSYFRYPAPPPQTPARSDHDLQRR